MNRWLITSSMRSQIINKILEIAGICSDDEMKNKELSNSRIVKDGKDQSALLENIGDMCNPFDININKEALFNIKTGKKVTEDAEFHLLMMISEGEKKQDSVIEERDYVPEKF